MAWKIYTSNGDRIPGEFKSKSDAELFWLRNGHSFRKKDSSKDKPIFVETGKGRGK